MNLWWALLITSVWLSYRVLEHRIRRSDVLFLMGTHNFILCSTLPTRQKASFSFLSSCMQKSQAHLLCNTLRKSTCDLFFIHFFLSSSFFFFNLYFSQASVIHQDFLRFIHVDDHDLIRKNLLPFPEDEEEQVCFVVFSIFFLAMCLL